MANYQKGDMFVIEITDVMTGEDGQTVYRMNDFNSLVFDHNGLMRLKKLNDTKAEPEKDSPFRRAVDDSYYFISGDGSVVTDWDSESDIDEERFAVANYCTDLAMLKRRAMHETLNRRLWRYSEERGGDQGHWALSKNRNTGEFIAYCASGWKDNGTVYFATKQTAENAIHDVVKPFAEQHPDFKW